MLKSLIPVLAALICVVTTLHAQVPEPTTVRKVDLAKVNTPDACGNDAGTFTIGPKGVTSKTNDINLPIIYLCANDSVFINHNGNAAFAGDPDPSTTPGIGWLFYKCLPTIAGDNLIDNILTDPCIHLNLSNIPSTPYVARGDISGDIWFWNNGNQISTFGGGQPVSLWFAPTTLDIFSGPGGLGTFEGAGKPGPCVNVNVADAFEVVYLNPIIADNLDNNAGNDCLGRFIIKGGFPQYDKTARYNINITKLNDPTKRALIHTPILQYKHGEPIVFSVSEPGQYLIEARDGKSCMLMDTVDMIACNPSDNVTITLPTLTLEPNDSVCLPILVNNYNNLISNSFTIAWDPTILQYDTVARPNSVLQFSAVNNLNPSFSDQGTLGFALARPNGSPMTIVNGQTLIEVCFKVIGSVGDCSPFTLLNNPALIDATKAGDIPAAVTPINGEICIAYDQLVLKDSIVDFKCDQTASLKVIVEGGQEPFEITYTPLLGGPVETRTIAKRGEVLLVPGLTNGDWIVCLRDNMGLGQSLCDTINVSVPSIGVNLDFVSPLCFNDKNGKATANVQIDAVPADPNSFTYAWAGTPGPLVQGQQVQNNIGAGNYTVTVTQKTTGCTQVASGSLSQPAKISNNFVVVTDATCSGVDDGSITVITKGGTAFPGSEYNFKWEYSPNGLPPFVNEPKGSGQTNPSVLANVLGGTYKTTITDANGCVFDTTIIVKNTFEIAVELVQIQNPKCFGGTDGMLTVQVKSTPNFPNATWGFTPTIIGGFTDSCWATGCKYKNLKSGKIGIQVIEQSGCSDTAQYVLTDPPLLTLSTVNTKNPTCKGVTDGSIEVKASGGTPATGNTYTYTWPTPLTPGPIKTNLSEGTYTVTVTDANNCSATVSASITLPQPPKITLIDSTSVKCGKDGVLEVRTSTAGVTFQWTTLTGQNLANAAKVDKLDGGQYIYIVKDANDCVSTDTVTLGSIIPLFVDTFTSTKPKCFGDKDGRIVVSIEGGQKNYSYSWNTTPVQTSSALINQPAGKYILTVKDAKGCELKDTFEILNPPSMSLGFTDFMPTRCVDTCDGKFSIQVNMSDGSKQDYTFKWSDNITLNDSIRTGLCIGKYTVTVTDLQNCFKELEVTMIGPDSIQIDTFITTPTTCNLDKDGTAEVKVKVGSGNGGPYTYRWNTTPVKNQARITGESAGAKNVTITDRRGCKKVFSGEIQQPLPIVIQLDNATTALPKCNGDSLGSKLQVLVSGGNAGNFTFAWEDKNGDPIGGNKNPLENVFAGTYDVTATDAKGCTGSISGLVLSEPPPVIGTFLPYDSLDCFGDETIIRIDQVTGGNGGPYKFSIDNGALLNIDFPVTIGGGDHVITYVDRNNCEFSDTINIPEPTELTVIFDPKEIKISLGESTDLIPTINNFFPVKKYTWTPKDSLTRSDTSFTAADPTQTIRYKLVVEDIKGCVGSGEVTVIVDPNRDVYIPNIFMPGNSSNLNFAFNVNVGPSVRNVNFMQVYNRWGELMYERKDFLPVFGDLGEGWDGRYRGDFVNPGVYIYVAEVTFKDGRVLLYRGDVTVVR